MRKATSLLLPVLIAFLTLGGCAGKKNESVTALKTADKEQTQPSSAQPFEGVLTMRTTIPEAGYTETRLFIAKQGVRTESTSHIQNMPAGLQMVILSPAETPGLIYLINGSQKNYTVVNTDTIKKESATEGSHDDYRDARIENLGKESLKGYNCTHVRITNRGTVMEMWVSKEILDYFTYARMQRAGDKNMPELAKRMKDAGLDGFPVKIWHKQANIITELTGVEKRGIDASLFRVPAGYVKAELSPLNPRSTEQQRKDLESMVKKMHEQMKSTSR